jgi:CRP-like cAMP-binding protein
MSLQQSSVRNLLLSGMSQEGFLSLRPHLEFADLPVNRILVEANEPSSDVFFLENGLSSVVATSGDGEHSEISSFGREGMTGSHVILTIDRTPNRTFMQVGGDGFRLPVVVFTEALAADAKLRAFFLRFVHYTEIQIAQTAVSNARYEVSARLARWLLMCHDRLDGDEMALTHDFLGLMIGVRRSGVTDHLHILEGIHAIKATRGHIRILDREKLIEIAGGCYGVAEREYKRVVN